MSVKWVEAPPPVRAGRPRLAKQPKWAKEARQFRARPNQWGILTDDASTALAWQLTHGQVVAFRVGRWEATARTLPTSKPGRGQVYVRYLGDDIEEDAS